MYLYFYLVYGKPPVMPAEAPEPAEWPVDAVVLSVALRLL